jgi:hypothetical protein
MPRKIFTAPAPALEPLAALIRENGRTAVLGGVDPAHEDGVVVWIEVRTTAEAEDYIHLAASAWGAYED